jgi:penicillin-binding protein 1A
LNGHGPPSHRRRNWILLSAVLVPAVVGGVALGVGLQTDLPDVKSLENYTPPLNTRVLAADGSPIASFGEQRRMLVAYKDIPKVFEQALVSVEDANFYHHNGIDLQGIARAVWHDVTSMSFEEGASTLTQQLARNLFLKPDKTMHRKLQEMKLAMEIERHYSKQEILTLYCNQVYMGHGRYGVEAASRYYFGKPAREMSLPEAALLAGLIQRPESLSPFRNAERAIRRRNHVLDRMVDAGYLTRAAATAAQRVTLAATHAQESVDLAPYFAEEVRRAIQTKFGEEAVYQAGLEVRTTLDPKLQTIANAALDSGLRALDKRQGWRGGRVQIPKDADPYAYAPPSWKEGVRIGGVTDGVIEAITGGRARVRVGPYVGSLGADEIAWTGRRNPASFLRPGQLVRVRLVAAESGKDAALTLEQEPKVEAALVALDPRSGGIRALVGGFDFGRSEFDRATQARRQAGSAFKPIVYAAALTKGVGPAHRLLDEPTVFVEPGTLRPYQPENYGYKYFGTLTLREALEHSANIATVRLLDEVGYEPVLDTARRLGLTTPLQPYPSMALGAFEVSLLELTSAYGTFANQGVRVEPHWIDEVLAQDGSTLDRTKPEVKDALSPQVAHLMNRLLEGVVTDGTGAAARTLGRPLAGKTGTTDDFTDAWFIGYTPDLVVGVWVGYDVKKTLGDKETGAQAALPIWQQVIESFYEGVPPAEFPVPEGISIASIDRHTGLLANDAAGCADVFPEAFLTGTEPSTYCSTAEHARLRLPYAFQRYPLGEDGDLQIPAPDLDALLASYPEAKLTGFRGKRLEVVTPEGPVSIGVERTSEPSAAGIPAALEGKVDASAWVGHDGRPARVVLLGGTRG